MGQVRSELIIDVGMHRGRDTEFYLAKGFKVVAIEADPRLVQKAALRLQNHVDQGDLVIVNRAISDRIGEVDFYANDEKDDWGTLSERFLRRNTARGSTHHRIKIRTIRLEDIIAEHGTPHYLKIDIEGMDYVCLAQLKNVQERPRFVSIETSLDRFEDVFSEFSLLWELGYRKFKIINQGLNACLRCPSPPQEGRYHDAQFDGHCSGLFGEETPGEWMSIERSLMAYRRILWEQKYFGPEGRFGRDSRIGGFYRAVKSSSLFRNPVAWYDVHAAR